MSNGHKLEGAVQMGKVIVEAEVSIDGCLGGDMDFWNHIFQFHSPDVQDYLDNLLFMPDALLMGKETYEGFAQVWPTREGKPADRINSMPKYVASRTLEGPLTWNATLIKGNVAEGIRKLKQSWSRACCSMAWASSRIRCSKRNLWMNSDSSYSRSLSEKGRGFSSIWA
jgi:hypothetical protein